MPDFLLEIGLEEVPARMLSNGAGELHDRILTLLESARLLARPGSLIYSTPRRLAVYFENVRDVQPEVVEQLTGPAWDVAFRNGEPTPAAHAFAKKAGVAIDRLEPFLTAKGKYTAAAITKPGRTAIEVLTELLPNVLAGISWPKPMYWRAGKPERFVRPVQWLVALLGDTVVPFQFAGIQSGRATYGHRVLHGPTPVELTSPANYEQQLRSAFVEPDVEVRRHTIRKALDHVTRTVENARWREDEKLVDTVTHLTEWPSVILGSFAPEYLALPEEVLVTVMRDHQKYFAVEDKEHKLLPHFLAVLNTEANERGEAIIRHGNERVLRARFNDAQFFWNFDQRTPLEERQALLADVTFHKDLGSYQQKTERMQAIAQRLATLVPAANAEALAQAAALAKVDLTTELVKEFTELQGIVGGLYCRAQALGEPVAQAIYWQYRPAAITDPIPPTVEGQLLGLADRIDTIVAMFGIGLAPSGSKDPYALRRAANGVIKILAASALPLRLSDVVRSATTDEALLATVTAFFSERIEFYLREVAGLAPDVVKAVLAGGSDDVPDAQSRGQALAAVRGSEDLVAIAAAWKRTKNILRQAAERQFDLSPSIDEKLLIDEPERALAGAVAALVPQVEAFRAQRNYRAALEQIATLRPHVDRFFDSTMVMAEDPSLRANRLALLSGIVRELGRIADFSELQPELAGRRLTEEPEQPTELPA